MKVVDTSVVVAAFASWHQLHEPARRALDRGPELVAHSALETYSVLTRLPPPHRAPGNLVEEFLGARFPRTWLVLSGDDHGALLHDLSRLDIAGGATYDAVIGRTVAQAGATLVTCDHRAIPIYQRIGAPFEVLG